jgi:hypothetical protein
LCLSPAGPVRQPFQQSGAPGYLLFLTEQAARPVIHTGIKIRELFDEAGAATAGVRRGFRRCGTWLSVPVVTSHTLNTLLLGELTARRLRSRMGIVYTTANRNWELHLALVDDRLRQSRALAVDMESATVAANGFRYRIPTATLLAVSDKPLHAQPKLSADAQDFYAASRRQHVEIAISVTEKVRQLYPGETACHTGRNNCSLAELIRFRGAKRGANEDRGPAV